MIHGQLERDARRLGPLDQALGGADELVFDERLADRPALRLEERVGHGAADEQRIDLAEQVLDDLELVRDLGAAEDRDERTLRDREAPVPRYSTSAAMRKPAADALA